ncbi:MAG: glycosyltransferase family 2 protein [Planctomycetota bacterium]|jgi:GT2 family glycosyltransferase
MIPVIIPAYKNKEQLEQCIDKLKNQTVPVEIFIRDNCDDNIYFTAAINEGIKKFLNETCQYMIILNQDMYLDPDAVEKMVTFMDSNQRCGIGTPLQLHSENRDYVIYAGCLEAFPLGKHQHGPLSQFTRDEEIFWGNAACMIFRKEMIVEIGLMDENFVFIGSDSDYCFTARARGWQVWRIASAKGVHEHGDSGTVSNSKIEKLKVDDIIYFGKKWLTDELYREMAYKSKDDTPEKVANIMESLKKVQTELEQQTVVKNTK